MNKKELIEASLGLIHGDLILKNCKIINVLSGLIQKSDILIYKGFIAAVGNYNNSDQIIDLEGKYIIPGLIDGHIHIESTCMTPPNFARAVLPHGTTTVIADPHEIVNVCGMDGFEYMLNSSKNIILDIFYMIPSCVPSSHLESSGAEFKSAEIEKAFQLHPQSPGLAEMMNFPGVINRDPTVINKIQLALDKNKLIDGHSPLLSGKDLCAYRCGGISSEHECTSAEEAIEKMGIGINIAIREGSAAKNLKDLLPAVNEFNSSNVFFCCDDRNAIDITTEGGINNIVRKAISLNIPPIRAIQMATINTAKHYRLYDRGAISPGMIADLVILDDLYDFVIHSVYKRGIKVAQNKKLSVEIKDYSAENVLKTISVLPNNFQIHYPSPPNKNCKAKVIEVCPNQIITRKILLPLDRIKKSKDICLVACINRYNNKSVKVGFIKGFGDIKGALASTVAHDSHNIITVGKDREDMIIAVDAVIKSGGGFSVVQNRKVRSVLSLPVAGLMSLETPETLAESEKQLNLAVSKISSDLPDPFMTMSFLSLPVIPELKITDLGIIDVTKFQTTSLWE